jgi:hypothetical protein
MVDLETAAFKHAQTVSETLENEIGRFERVISAFEKYIDTQTSGIRDMLQKYQEENNNWKVQFEDINTKKVVEIHAALKLLNSNIGKVNSDNKDRFDMLSNEMRVHENAVSTQIQDLRNKVEVDDNSLEDRINLAVDKVHDRLKGQLDSAVADYNKLVRDSNALLSERFDLNNKEIKGFID